MITKITDEVIDRLIDGEKIIHKQRQGFIEYIVVNDNIDEDIWFVICEEDGYGYNFYKDKQRFKNQLKILLITGTLEWEK